MKKKPKDQNDNQLAEELSRLVQALAAAGKVTLPGSPDALLNSIVEAAARIFGAAAASILLVNEEDGVLEFKVAHGATNRDLVGTRIPLDQGIAGYVVMSQQPIAISDVDQDVRFNRDFAQSTGYVPHSILATPLTAGGRILGVMEVLDKINAPSFGMQDMELLGLFAHQAALAIDQTQNLEHLGEALLLSLKRLASLNEEHPSDNLMAALEVKPDAEIENELLQLVDLLNKFSQMGDAEREMGLKVLSVLVEYGQNQDRMRVGVSW